MIRNAVEDDGKELLAIYAPYVKDTAVTFEYEVPSLEEFKKRICRIHERYPYLVLEENGIIYGYAYAAPFKSRKAYDWSSEVSVYLRKDARYKGYGEILYRALETALSAQGIVNACACIPAAAENDPYVTEASISFHKKMGYIQVGRFHHIGYKFDRWYDIIWMQKELPTPSVPAPV